MPLALSLTQNWLELTLMDFWVQALQESESLRALRAAELDTLRAEKNAEIEALRDQKTSEFEAMR